MTSTDHQPAEPAPSEAADPAADPGTYPVRPWSPLKRALYIAVALAVAVFGYAVYDLQRTRPLLQTGVQIWLPSDTVTDRDSILDLPVTYKVEQGTPYGNVVRIDADKTDTDTGLKLFQANVSPRLNPADCPNVFDEDELLPQGCDRIGDVGGQAVYRIYRRLPSQNSDIFTVRGSTFIAITGYMLDPSDKDVLDYVSSLQPIESAQLGGILGVNRQKVEAEQGRQEQEAKAKAARDAAAYTHLPFTPVLPATLPDGWKRSVKPSIRGTAPERPERVQIQYVNAAKDFVSVNIISDKDYDFGGNCRIPPVMTPEAIVCTQAAGEDFYRGSIDQGSYSSRYIFRHIGDAAVIVNTTAHASETGPPAIPEAALQAMEAISASLRPADTSAFKDSDFMQTSW